MRTRIASPASPPPAGPYSPGMVHNGVLYLAGQGPFDAEGKRVGETFADQVRLTFGNLQANCWIAGFVGNLAGSVLSGYVHAALGTAGTFLATAAVKVAMLSLPAALHDPKVPQRVACKEKGAFGAIGREIVIGADAPRVWRPALFLFAFHAMPNNGDAWSSFLYGDPSVVATAWCTR